MHKKNIHLRMTLVLGVILFLSGCKQSSSQKNLSALNDPLLQQAKHADIPSPLGFTALSHKNNSSNSGKTVFCYRGSLSTKKSTEYYQHAMELTGWEIRNFSTESEGLLICTKPNKQCAISIRPEKHKTNIRIVVDHTQIIPTIEIAKHEAEHEDEIDIINQKKIIVS